MTPSGQTSETSASPSAQQSLPGRLLGNCWSCRIITGSGLLISAGYVFLAARRVMRAGGQTTFGNVAQISFAACLAAWGIVVIADPIGKASRKA